MSSIKSAGQSVEKATKSPGVFTHVDEKGGGGRAVCGGVCVGVGRGCMYVCLYICVVSLCVCVVSLCVCVCVCVVSLVIFHCT